MQVSLYFDLDACGRNPRVVSVDCPCIVGGGGMVRTMWAGTDLYMNTNLLSQSSQLWGVLYMM